MQITFIYFFAIIHSASMYILEKKYFVHILKYFYEREFRSRMTVGVSYAFNMLLDIARMSSQKALPIYASNYKAENRPSYVFN